MQLLNTEYYADRYTGRQADADAQTDRERQTETDRKGTLFRAEVQ